MARSYEELHGALDERIHYRPRRQKAGQLFSFDSQPTIAIVDRRYPVFDISSTGVSFFCESSEEFEVGQEVHVTIEAHGQELHSDQARVVRIELRSRGSKVGLAFPFGFVDLDEVTGRYSEEELRRELSRGPDPFNGAIREPYKDQVVRAYNFLMHCRRVLGDYERSQGELSDSQLREAAARAAETLRPAWREICSDASKAAIPLLRDQAALRAAKQFTETLITPLLTDCPMVRRSYEKPLGYPGDYQVMLYYYDNSFEGESLYSKVFHKFFVEHPLSHGVATRSQYVVDLIMEELGTRSSSNMDPYRILSIGCGPAHEAKLLYSNELASPIEWLLIDQEEEALDVAFRNAKKNIAEAGRPDSCRLFNTSFTKLINSPSDVLPEMPQDFIFCTGLFDYLRIEKARALVAALYDWLAPGGMIAVGNALAPNTHFWSPEFVLDWSLLYRTSQDMCEFAAGLPSSASFEVTTEPGGAYHFLLVRKPRE
jgi:SAM-dependent methyltransferase